jgi:hypothetical protein
MFLEHVPFFEGTRIEQQFDALAGAQLALGVLAVDALLATAEAGHFTLFFQLANDVVHKDSLNGTGDVKTQCFR